MKTASARIEFTVDELGRSLYFFRASGKPGPYGNQLAVGSVYAVEDALGDLYHLRIVNKGGSIQTPGSGISNHVVIEVELEERPRSLDDDGSGRLLDVAISAAIKAVPAIAEARSAAEGTARGCLASYLTAGNPSGMTAIKNWRDLVYLVGEQNTRRAVDAARWEIDARTRR